MAHNHTLKPNGSAQRVARSSKRGPSVALLPTTPETSRESSIRERLLTAALVQEGKTDEAWPHLARAIDNPVLTN